MGSAAQKKANRDYRARLGGRGVARMEVMAPEGDRELIRALARGLSREGPQSEQLRAAVQAAVAGEKPASRGGILQALRRSPLVDAELDLSRPRERGREVDL
jgi:hypothetical protein